MMAGAEGRDGDWLGYKEIFCGDGNVCDGYTISQKSLNFPFRTLKTGHFTVYIYYTSMLRKIIKLGKAITTIIFSTY